MIAVQIYPSFSGAGLSLLVVTKSLLLKDVQVVTLVLGKSDQRLLGSDNENVGLSGGEGLAVAVLEMHDIEAAQVTLDVEDLADSTDVVSTGHVGEMSSLVADPLGDLVLLEVELDGVALVDFGVGEADGAGVVGDDVGDLVGSDGLALDLEELELGLGVLDLVEGDSALDVVQQSVVLVGLGDGDDVHDSHGELDVTSWLVIDLNAGLFILDDDVGFATSEGKSEAVPGVRQGGT